MQCKLTIDMDNAAFQPDGNGDGEVRARAAGAELARILRDLARKVEDGCLGGDMVTARDLNGNACGTLQVTR